DGAVRSLVSQAVDTYGGLDCAANCAGVGAGHATTHEYSAEEWDRIVGINLRGTWLSMRHEIDAMLAVGGGGTIVNVCSTLGLRGSAFSSPSSASKHGVLGLNRTAASLCRPSAVRSRKLLMNPRLSTPRAYVE